MVPTTVKGQALMHEDTYEPAAVIRTVIFSLQFTHRHISITLFRERQTNLTLTYRLEDKSLLGYDTLLLDKLNSLTLKKAVQSFETM